MTSKIAHLDFSKKDFPPEMLFHPSLRAVFAFLQLVSGAEGSDMKSLFLSDFNWLKFLKGRGELNKV